MNKFMERFMDREVGKRLAPRTRQEPRTQIALLWEKLGELEERIKELEARHEPLP